MSKSYSRLKLSLFRILTVLAIVSITSTAFPPQAFAVTQEESSVETILQESDDGVATSTVENNVDDEEEGLEVIVPDTATTTDSATSTEDITDSGDEEVPDVEGVSTATTSEETGSSTPEVAQGVAGDAGSGGAEGSGGESGIESTDVPESDPIPVISESEIGDAQDEPEEEDITGGYVTTKRNSTIVTGNATARGEVATDVNSNNVRSEFGPTSSKDLDVYTFHATGSNEAEVDTSGAIISDTGDNKVLSSSGGASEIFTGDAISVLNIANVVNSNIVNSDGFLFLLNKQLEEGSSLDLRDFFFPDPDSTLAGAHECTLLSCMAEDVKYTFAQKSDAALTNDATILSNTGQNTAKGDYAHIETGDAYGGANVVNVVNTNIVDSNYRLLTLNAIGDLDGDLMLPTQELFHAFFGRPNGMTQTESAEEIDIRIENTNEALVDNNLETYAETGLNESTTVFDSEIKTGVAESESNVLNRINTNVYGGDSMYLLIKIHGYWSGDVVGLPEGLSWEWTPEGIVIYNTDAEIAPSEILSYDVDSYQAYVTDVNNATVTNNIRIDAISGENTINGLIGDVQTGDAFASANVMNIVNTNIIGTNFSMAVINIFGDFDGDVTFTQTDLQLTGDGAGDDDPLIPGSAVRYTYQVTNNSTVPATDVVLRQALQGGLAAGNVSEQSKLLGTIAPGATKEVVFHAVVNPELDMGITTVRAVAEVTSNESENDPEDNTSLITLTVSHDVDDPDEGDGSAPVVIPPVVGGGSSGGGGSSSGSGGGGRSSKTKSIDREQNEVDANAAAALSIQKHSSITNGDIVIAGTEVDYVITVSNSGGTAYDATVYDTLRNPIGSVLDEQFWSLGTVLPGEEVTLTYTTAYNFDTPSGVYTNTASIEAYAKQNMKNASGSVPIVVQDAVHTIEIKGKNLAIGNTGVLTFIPAGRGVSAAIVTWEISKPSDGQIFLSRKVGDVSPFNPQAVDYGYEQKSLRFTVPKIKHFMFVGGLRNGETYTYRIRSSDGIYTAFGGDYTFTVPGAIVPAVVPRVLSAVAPVPKPAPSIVQKPTVVPAPIPVAVLPLAPEPVPAEVSTPPPDISPEEKPAGGFGGVLKKVFGLFR